MHPIRPTNKLRYAEYLKHELQSVDGKSGLVIGDSRADELYTHHQLPDLGFGDNWINLSLLGARLEELIWTAKHTGLDLSSVHVIVIPDAAINNLARTDDTAADCARGYENLLSALLPKCAPDCRVLIGEILPEGPDVPRNLHYDDGVRQDLNDRLHHLDLDGVHYVNFPAEMDDPLNAQLYVDELHFTDFAMTHDIDAALESAWSHWLL